MKSWILVIIGTFLLVGCGGGGDSSPQSQNVNAPPIGGGGDSSPQPQITNTPPVANAGPNQSVLAGTWVTLDGSASIDADNDPLTYVWAIKSKPAGSNAVLSSNTSPKPTFIADIAGSYTASLVVNDGKVNSAEATVMIIAAIANAAPVANAGLAQNVATGTLVTLDGSGSSDANGDALTYLWTLTSKPDGSAALLSSASAVKPTFIADISGTFFATLIVNDGELSSAEATTFVTASVANIAPVADAGMAQNVMTETLVTLDGSGSSDANGDALTYLWTLTSKPDGSAALLSSSSSVKPTFLADLAGIYVFKLVVNDGSLSSAAATTTVTAEDFGKITTKIGESSGIRSIVMQPDGKIIAAGASVTIGRPDVAVARYNVDGSLDTSFANDGVVTTNIAGRIASTDWVRGVVLQSDGKIVVAGYSVTYGSDVYGLALVRYNPDGSLDASFSDGGIVITTDPSRNFMGNSVALQADGKIVVAGSATLGNRYTYGGYGTLLVRYNSDGSLDTTFATNGIHIDTSTKGVQGVVLQPDGKILVTGGMDYGDYLTGFLALARYNSDGSLDTTFSGNGIINTEIGSEVGSGNTSSSLALQPDGKIVVAGLARIGFGSVDFAVVRYNPDGSLDISFSGDGIVTTDFNSASDFAWSIAIQTDGKIVLAGESTSVRSDPYPFPGVYRPGNVDFALAKYNIDGSLDTSFSSDGKIITDFRKLEDRAYSVVIQSDGKILAAGSSFNHDPADTYNGGHNVFALARYMPDGSLDLTFRSGE